MTEDEILRIKMHIEIHARREPGAIKITQILRKAVEELEHIVELEKENDRLSRKCECLTKNNESLVDIANDVERLEKQVGELKKCLRGITYMAESGLHTKNKLAFARCIAEAQALLKE